MSMDILSEALAALDDEPAPAPEADAWRSIGAVLRDMVSVEPVAEQAAAPNVPVAVQPEPEAVAESEPSWAALKRALTSRPADEAPWCADWFDRLDILQVRACRSLWAEVMRMVLVDLLLLWQMERSPGDRRIAGVRLGSTPNERSSAELWAFSRDFYMVADLAGFDGRAIADRLRQIRGNPDACADMLNALSYGQGNKLSKKPGPQARVAS